MTNALEISYNALYTETIRRKDVDKESVKPSARSEKQKTLFAEHPEFVQTFLNSPRSTGHKLTKEHKQLLLETSRASWTPERRKKHEESHRARLSGKTYEELYGAEKAAEMRAAASKRARLWAEAHPERLARKESGKKISESLKQGYAEGRITNKGGYTRSHRGFREDLGHLCRSSWEANIARLIKWFKVDYAYEPTRFKLSDCSYLIDFYLTKFDHYVEVKGYDDGRTDKLLKEFPNMKIHVVREAEYIVLCLKYRSVVPNWENTDYQVYESSTTARQALLEVQGAKIQSVPCGNTGSVAETTTPLELILLQK